MITSFHVLFLFGLIAGLFYGGSFGWHRFGVVGLIPGGLIGLLAGGFIGWVPGYLAILIPALWLRHVPSLELRKRLHEDNSLPNFILVELKRRGEDVLVELPFVWKMLTSENALKRTEGWAAFISAYPELLEKVPRYNPTDSTEVCRTNSMSLEELISPS